MPAIEAEVCIAMVPTRIDPATTGFAGFDPTLFQPTRDLQRLRGLAGEAQLDQLGADGDIGQTQYERELPNIPAQVRQQALLTEQAIRERAQ